MGIPSGVTGIVLSWVFSPVLSAICAAVMINMFFILSKGIAKKICPKGDGTWICKPEGKTKPEVALGVSVACGIVAAILCTPLYSKIREWITNAGDLESNNTSTTSDTVKEAKPADIEVAPTSGFGKFKKAMMTSLDTDPHASIGEEQRVAAIHANAEKFDPQAEAVFRYIQIFTAICDSFAHGANDVANAMGPFMGIYVIYQNGKVSSKSDAGDDAYWILAL